MIEPCGQVLRLPTHGAVAVLTIPSVIAEVLWVLEDYFELGREEGLERVFSFDRGMPQELSDELPVTSDPA